MTKKVLLLSALSILFSWNTKAGCPLINVPVQERLNESGLVVEATVRAKFSYKNPQGNFIYTAHTLEIHKIFKGSTSQEYITLLTEGGTVGLERLDVNPSLHTELGQSGVFFLSPNTSWANPEGVTQSYYSRTGALGFVYYDRDKKEAFDLKNKWGSVQNSFLPLLKSLTGQETIRSYPETPTFGVRRTTPVITNVSPASIPAGTRQVLTITGSSFGATRGSGEVQFPNANDGGNSYITAHETDYISWSDTEIRLLVRTMAGTGKVKVLNNSGNTGTSANDLTVTWAHLNVSYEVDSLIGSQSFEIRHKDNNGSGGLTWTWDAQFRTNTDAVNSFIRALETWRCNTLINWDTLGTAANDTNLKDNQNMVFFDKGWLPSSTLGVCYSWYNGCFTGGSNMEWYVSELDIVFKKSANWEYGPAPASGGKTDFESVALHELGHGHQLGHVINEPNVMHYAIGPNTNKRSLQSHDTACGNYIMNKSIVSVCSNPAMTKIHPDNCQFTELIADFSADNMSPCAFDTVIFSDLSQGGITSWQWNFGLGATPATASGKGPHKVVYSTGGNKTVKLDVTAGTQTETKQVPAFFNVNSDAQPDAAFTATLKKGCEMEFTITNPASTSTYNWDFNGEGTGTGILSFFTFSNGGTVDIEVTANNNCGSATENKIISFLCTDFAADRDTLCIADTVTFSNLSETADTLIWNFGAEATPPTATGIGSHRVVYGSGGIKTVTLTSGNASSSQTVSQNVLVKNADKPTALFSVEHQGNNTFLFQNQSSGLNNSYVWDFGDGNPTVDVESPLYVYAENPSGFTVKLLASNACDEDEYTLTMADHTSVASLSDNAQWLVYPNPAGEVLYIKAANEAVAQKIVVTDIQGKVLQEEVFTNQVQHHSLNLSTLSSGIYTLSIYSPSGVFRYSFSKI